MTREELIKKLLKTLNDKDNNYSEKEVKDIVISIISTVNKSLKDGKRVEIRGFGTFSSKIRLPRKARNPKSGEKITTGEKKIVSFKPGKTLKERLNK